MDMYLNNSGMRNTIATVQALFLIGVGYFALIYLIRLWEIIKEELKNLLHIDK